MVRSAFVLAHCVAAASARADSDRYERCVCTISSAVVSQRYSTCCVLAQPIATMAPGAAPRACS